MLIMVKTASTMLPLGTRAPEFSLLNVDGRTMTLASFERDPALLVIFMCNHCPFVKHIAPKLAELASEYQQQGVAVVAINPNDAANYPDDSPERMIHEVEERGYPFPYLYDETQEVAKAYHAACTPDFFLFDKKRQLAYRGQLDSSRPGNNIPVSGEDLTRAVYAVLAGKPVPEPHKPSIGCNIKWKPRNEPEYFNPAGVP
jgi:thiol-disulfide isomerase/thioredoxin